MIKINPSVLEHILQMQQQGSRPQDQHFVYELHFITLGTASSGNATFFQSLYQYVSFGQKGKIPKHLKMHAQNKRKANFAIDIFNLEDNLDKSKIEKISPLAAFLFYSEDDLDSIQFTKDTMDNCYKYISQHCKKIQQLETHLTTLDDFARYFEFQEAKPALIIVGVKGKRRFKEQANQLRKYAVSKNYRYYDIAQIDAMSYKLVFDQAFCLAEIYPFEFFSAWKQYVEKQNGCIGE